MKRLLAAALVLALCFAGCKEQDKALLWAKELAVEEVATIEAVRMPALEGERYRRYGPEEFGRIVALINAAEGRRIDGPQGVAGGGLTFYVTTQDGVRHTITNSGNVYLVADGVYFDAPREWLGCWNEEKMDSVVPEGFVY